MRTGKPVFMSHFATNNYKIRAKNNIFRVINYILPPSKHQKQGSRDVYGYKFRDSTVRILKSYQ